ncbi:MAG: ATP-binding protein, partial [Rickettsiales bacterium]
MDPRLNPYSPGAGNPPPEFSGRDQIIEQTDIALDRIKSGRPTRGFILYGLRGVGKTVLLNKIALEAEAKNLYVVRIESPEDRSLPAILIPTIRSTLLKISKGDALKNKLAKAMRAVGGFAAALKIKYSDIEIGFNLDKEAGMADSGDLELDLVDLLTVVGEAAAENHTAIIISIDELQYVPEEQLSALITALHRASQKQLPVMMVAAGLPQLLGQMGRAKSYAERLFEFIPVDKLDEISAKDALCKPAAQENVNYNDDAIEEILKQTQGYPYFLQEWGKH